MNTKPDTDFSQFTDAAEIPKCPAEDCPEVNLLERRVDRHRIEIEELKRLVQKNSSDTAEILEIVTMGKNFFKVLGWLGTAIKTIAAVGVPIAAFLYWLKK